MSQDLLVPATSQHETSHRSYLAAILLALSLLASCTYAGGDPAIFISSTPAGGSILIDGEKTGETTPAKIELGGYFGTDHEVTIRKRGFEPETRMVRHHRAYYSSKWVDGSTTFWFLSLPFFWTFGDFFVPFGVKWAYVPKELHVKLYPEGEAPGRR